MKEFKVVAVSGNRNSFGLRGVVLVARDGQSYEVGSNDLHLPKEGDVLAVPTRPGTGLDWGSLGFEIPMKLDPPAPPEVVRQVWSHTLEAHHAD
jgi:hypothetical protein